eukprot:GILK01019017.1.p1 GENE.GILK01019017.1~~GILK01019017.1.p1  ORF type:complete len:136 (-),score=2.91 GILK01019017.1:448-855(-)
MQILDEYRVPAMAVCHPATCAAIGIRKLYPSLLAGHKIVKIIFLNNSAGDIRAFEVDLDQLISICVKYDESDDRFPVFKLADRIAKGPVNRLPILRDPPPILDPFNDIDLHVVLATGYLDIASSPNFSKRLTYRL